MKISNSKKQLAKIIHENGGWRDGAKFAAQGGNHGHVGFASVAPVRNGKVWDMTLGFAGKFLADEILPNWHQTILSRDEYFHLYPAPDADGWIEWKGGECPVEKGTLVDVIWGNGTERAGVKALQLGGAGHQFWVADGMTNDIIAYRLHKPEQAKPEFCESVMRSIPEPEVKPTIEQLAADRKQQEADTAKADAEAKLAELVAAGKALGLVLSVAEPELVITDWRDLRVGDVVEVTGSDNPGWVRLKGVESLVTRIGLYEDDVSFRPRNDDGGDWAMSNNTEWRFIRRPPRRHQCLASSPSQRLVCAVSSA